MTTMTMMIVVEEWDGIIQMVKLLIIFQIIILMEKFYLIIIPREKFMIVF